MSKKTTLTETILEEYANDPESGFHPEVSDDPIINVLNYCKTGIDWEKQNGFDGKSFKAFIYNYYKLKNSGDTDALALLKARDPENWQLAMEYEEKYDKMRLKYDGDARHYNDLCGDTVTPFWTPYKFALSCKELYPKGREFYCKTNKDLDELIAKRNDPGYKEVNNFFTELAELCHTKGNFMLLPAREMNPARYSYKDSKGMMIRDRIDKTLYECFEGGALAKFFFENEGSDEHTKYLINWVAPNNLESLVEYDEEGRYYKLERDGIIPFNKSNPFVPFEDMDYNEIVEFVKSAVGFIKERNK